LQLHRLAGLVAGFVCLAVASPAAAGPANVTLRVEGTSSTVVEEMPVRTVAGSFDKQRSNPDDPAEGCSNTSAGGALDQGVGGDWDGPWFPGSYAVERVRGESHPFTGSDYYSIWVNHRALTTSLCDAELQEGDEVLLFVDRCEDDPNSLNCLNDPVLPLGLQVPATASTGAASTVTVVRYDAQGQTEPVGGARVTGPGVDAVTTGDGKASVTFGQAGSIRLKASAAGFARSAPETVSVSAPGQPVVAPPVARDTAAPVARILGIRDGQRFKRKRAPRTLRGSVSPDPSGLQAVKLSLTRASGGRCQLYSPTRERFRGSRCGRRVNFAIGDRQDWSYLLPERLGKGRYVLDAIAVDKAGNRDRPTRGRNRVVFIVR
jgi:hypothetical protein